MNVLIIDNTSRGDEAFNKPLVEAFSKLADVTVKKHTDIKTTGDIRGHDAVVLSGVPIDYPYELAKTIHRVIRYSLKLDVPMLGICLGHEGIGTLFGAKLFTAREKVDGTHKINTKPTDPIFKNMPSSFPTRELHEASITIPPQFELIASSNKCYNMAMRHRSKPVYGLQFHPEFRPTRLRIFSNFIDIARQYSYSKTKAKDFAPAAAG